LALWKCSTWHPKIQRLILKSAALGAHKLKYFKSIGVDTGAALFGRQTLHFLIDKHNPAGCGNTFGQRNQLLICNIQVTKPPFI